MVSNSKKRIESLDLLRGFALLGILIMNIISFSNIGTGYINPKIGAGIEGLDGIIHGFSYLFADTRFMSIFSILFGAGVLLFSESIIRKKLSPVRYHYRRMFWLFLFGNIHAYLIWSGDILVSYAICGCFVFLMKKWSIKKLYIIGGIFFLVPLLLNLSNGLFTPQSLLEEQFEFFEPPQEKINYEIAAYRGGFVEQMPQRVAATIELQTFLFFIESFWRIMSMMLLGIILFKKNILTGQRSITFYKKMFALFFTSGLILSAIGLQQSYAYDWSGSFVMTFGACYTYVASLLMALGYIGLIMWWSKTSLFQNLKAQLKAAGRMAFTNYIGMSVICTFIYYGHGLGLFATMNRLSQMGVVIAIWLLMLFISPIILERFRQGPLEKLWRKLTYWNFN